MISSFHDLVASSARRSLAIVAAGFVLAGAPWSAQADEPAEPDWACSCLTFEGKPDNCHMFADITGPVMNFGAFETSGTGPYSVESANGETVVKGDLTSATGSKMTVIIVQPDGGKPALVFLDERKQGAETFTAECKGKLPARK